MRLRNSMWTWAEGVTVTIVSCPVPLRPSIDSARAALTAARDLRPPTSCAPSQRIDHGYGYGAIWPDGDGDGGRTKWRPFATTPMLPMSLMRRSRLVLVTGRGMRAKTVRSSLRKEAPEMLDDRLLSILKVDWRAKIHVEVRRMTCASLSLCCRS